MDIGQYLSQHEDEPPHTLTRPELVLTLGPQIHEQGPSPSLSPSPHHGSHLVTAVIAIAASRSVPIARGWPPARLSRTTRISTFSNWHLRSPSPIQSLSRMPFLRTSRRERSASTVCKIAASSVAAPGVNSNPFSPSLIASG